MKPVYYLDPSYFDSFKTCQEFIVTYANEHPNFNRNELLDAAFESPWQQSTVVRTLSKLVKQKLIYGYIDNFNDHLYKCGELAAKQDKPASKKDSSKKVEASSQNKENVFNHLLDFFKKEAKNIRIRKTYRSAK